MTTSDYSEPAIRFPASPEAFERADVLMAEAIAQSHEAAARPILVGLSGAQGSGKTTTSARLVARLEAMGLRTLVLALDDFYLTRAERAALAGDIHPLLATRGVPGTHDVKMMVDAVRRLSSAAQDAVAALPSFDKAQDDRAPEESWPTYRGRPDVMILEGWCIGARPQAAADLLEPINTLEAEEDADGAWRTFVNDQLAGPYAELFAAMDYLIALSAPSFDCVHGWRSEQEHALRLRAPEGRRIMSDAELNRFIAHYERITRVMIEHPAADLVIRQGRDRRPLEAFVVERRP
jgi:D-glycerate 3-kinase